MKRERSLEWNQCLVVGLAETEPLVADMVRNRHHDHDHHHYHEQVGDPDWGEYWDLCLDRTLTKDWSSQAYRFINSTIAVIDNSFAITSVCPV